jgi:branched-chain amino acid transport system substrate-binding protein
VRTYLKAVETAGTDNPDKVMATLKSLKIDDFYNKGYIRKDGRFVHDMYVFEAKRPGESAMPWDYLRLIRVVPGEEAFQLPTQPKCALLKKDAT